MSMLKTDNIFTYYGEVCVLKNINLQVEDGELVSLFGPNGHGKSTLLKTICGLIKPVKGEVIYNDERLDKMKMTEIVEKGVVYVPEDRDLFPQMTVEENLLMGSNPKRAREMEIRNMEYVFDLFPKLKVIRKQFASTLSGGEARMLTIGRGLMSNPDFLAIDEPSLGLAPNLRKDVFNSIDGIRNKGVSILLVEQSTPLAAEIADRIYLLEEGEITFSGKSDKALSDEQLKKLFFGV